MDWGKMHILETACSPKQLSTQTLPPLRAPQALRRQGHHGLARSRADPAPHPAGDEVPHLLHRDARFFSLARGLCGNLCPSPFSGRTNDCAYFDDMRSANICRGHFSFPTGFQTSPNVPSGEGTLPHRVL